METIITLFSAFTGVYRMLIFGRRMTKRAWLIYASLALALLGVALMSVGSGLSALFEAIDELKKL